MTEKKRITYQDAINEIETIVAGIEEESINIDALAEKVKRASFLIGFCRERLKMTEEDLKKIIDNMKEDDPAAAGASDR